MNGASPMKILALEFSSPQRSVAVVQGNTLKGGHQAAPFGVHPLGCPPHANSVSEVIETGALATQALGMIETALRQAQLEREQIECLAIGLGPGSYTGIRLAIALAQGWQLAAGAVRLLGMSTVECLVAQGQAEGITGQVAAVIDAQRGEFYLAAYEISGAARHEIAPLRLASRDEVQRRSQAGELLIGPEVTRWFPNARTLFPRAAMLGQLALGRNDFQAAETLQPIYLRETKFVKAPKLRIPIS